MPTAITTVKKTKRRPLRVTATGSTGQPTAANLAFSQANASIAFVEVDPSDNRRFKILGANVGVSDVTIGSGPNALVVTVTVEELPVDPTLVNRVDLVEFEAEE